MQLGYVTNTHDNVDALGKEEDEDVEEVSNNDAHDKNDDKENLAILNHGTKEKSACKKLIASIWI